jgi:hypothetical protein
VAKVEVYDGTVDLGSAQLADGAWSYTASGLHDGVHHFSVVATDTAGNSTASIAVGDEVTVDTTPPTISSIEEAQYPAGRTLHADALGKLQRWSGG